MTGLFPGSEGYLRDVKLHFCQEVPIRAGLNDARILILRELDRGDDLRNSKFAQTLCMGSFFETSIKKRFFRLCSVTYSVELYVFISVTLIGFQVHSSIRKTKPQSSFSSLSSRLICCVTVRTRQSRVCFLVGRLHTLAASGYFSCTSRTERLRIHFLQKTATKRSGYVCTFCTKTVRRLLMG